MVFTGLNRHHEMRTYGTMVVVLRILLTFINKNLEKIALLLLSLLIIGEDKL